MPDRRPKNTFTYFIATVILIGATAFYNGDFNTFFEHPAPEEHSVSGFSDNGDPTLSNKAVQHILYGDQSGGGHKYGVGKPCKSEFPKSWDDETILSVIRKISANDTLSWKKQDNGYYVAETKENEVKIRIVVNGDKSKIITAYPLNTLRNPCPANDNSTQFNR